jgi:hypothetical protein
MKVNEKFPVRSLSYTLITVLILLIFSLGYSNPMINAAENFDRYWSVLTGDQQIPPVITNARGLVGLKFLDNFSRLVYIVNTENIGNVIDILIYEWDKRT